MKKLLLILIYAAQTKGCFVQTPVFGNADGAKLFSDLPLLQSNYFNRLTMTVNKMIVCGASMSFKGIQISVSDSL